MVKIKAQHHLGDTTVPDDEVAEGLFCVLTGGPWEYLATSDPETGARTPSLVPAEPDGVAVYCFMGVLGVVVKEGEASQSAGRVAGSWVVQGQSCLQSASSTWRLPRAWGSPAWLCSRDLVPSSSLPGIIPPSTDNCGQEL